MGTNKPRFSDGEVYYRVKYFDGERKYPLIDTFVYVGKNLSDDDAEDTWYFQYSESFANDGRIETPGGGERLVHCATATDVSDFLDADSLFDRLRDALERRRR